jgi:hypothetical protein
MEKLNLLLLDDERTMESVYGSGWESIFIDDKEVKKENININIFRDFKEAQKYIIAIGFPDILLLDENLGYGFGSCVQYSGYTFVEWMIHYNESIPKGIYDTRINDIFNIKLFKYISSYDILDTPNLYYDYINKLKGITTITDRYGTKGTITTVVKDVELLDPKLNKDMEVEIIHYPYYPYKSSNFPNEEELKRRKFRKEQKKIARKKRAKSRK